MSERSRYDAVVLGAGPGGRGCATRLNDAGLRVAMLEMELVGGECPFWACIPSKTLLRPAEVASEARHAAGLSEPAAAWQEIREYRDYMNSGLDDSAKYESYRKRGIDVIRGRGQIAEPGRVQVGDRLLETERIVIATGTTAALPDLEGLDGIEYWTNREATTLTEVPQSTVVLGGGPVGIELAQMLSRYGSQVTIVEAADGLLAREHTEVGEMLGELMSGEGIEIRTGARAQRVEQHGPQALLHLAGGEVIEAERVLVATGRAPRVRDLGLELVDVDYDERGVKVDERCRAAPGVWAVGDVTGVAPFTHVAAYQARVVAKDIRGIPTQADYRAIPRVVFSDPEVAAVGLTPTQAGDSQIETAQATVDLADVDRTETYGRGLDGKLGLLADARAGKLVGAWAVGPLASEWIHTAVLAIKAEIQVAVLADTVIQFPTFSEAMLLAVDRLQSG
jgi:pyruvate/2-oxoglutarate dehydrogenase complex dihydrolipoamide dehydrogenase (E3) component